MPILLLSTEAGVSGEAGAAAARPATTEHPGLRRGRGAVTTPVQGQGATSAAGTQPRLETVTTSVAQGTEAGGPGAPTPPAALHVEAAPEQEPGPATTRPHHVEARHVQEAQQPEQKPPTATPTPAPGTAAPTPMT